MSAIPQPHRGLPAYTPYTGRIPCYCAADRQCAPCVDRQAGVYELPMSRAAARQNGADPYAAHCRYLTRDTRNEDIPLPYCRLCGDTIGKLHRVWASPDTGTVHLDCARDQRLADARAQAILIAEEPTIAQTLDALMTDASDLMRLTADPIHQAANDRYIRHCELKDTNQVLATTRLAKDIAELALPEQEAKNRQMSLAHVRRCGRQYWRESIAIGQATVMHTAEQPAVGIAYLACQRWYREQANDTA